MPFIPHTDHETQEMLSTIGVASVDELFDEIPKSLPQADITALPEGLCEKDVTRLIQDHEPNHELGTCFIGAGAYEHHIPAAVWQIASRGEFYTAYTPYQAEASQGSLQLIYEYQTMMAELTAMEASNASMYDGATALSEACLMAIRIKRSKVKKILLPNNVNPAYQKVLQTILYQQDIELVNIAFDLETGLINQTQLMQVDAGLAAALVIPQPNFFGGIEQADALTDWAHQHKLLVIGVVNPLAMALLKPAGQWGAQGADIVCGEGQPLGVPLSYGGPYFGFLCCNMLHIRQMPGRIVGRTCDQSGKTAYTLTLQAREQHIRRAKATSNICTNQGLMVVAASIYMSLMGAKGLYETALLSHQRARQLASALSAINGVTQVFSAHSWHEFVVTIDQSVSSVMTSMQAQGIQAGFDLSSDYTNLKNALLVCVTETKTQADLDRYVATFKSALKR